MRTTAASSMFGGDPLSTTLTTENSSPHFNKDGSANPNIGKQTTTPGSRNQNLGPSGAGGNANIDEGDSDSATEDTGAHNQDKKKKKKNKKKNKKKHTGGAPEKAQENERQSRPLEQT